MDIEPDMRSKAHFKTHPIHPMLVGFPIAFFFLSFITDVLLLFNDDTLLKDGGKYLVIAGIISALAAAIPGILDYIYTVPDNSSAKKRATKHALLNSSAVTCFVFSLVIREFTGGSLILLLLIDVTGVVLLSFAGWHGGTLVYRNQIGVDIRYAGAGKWKEEHFKERSSRILAAKQGEIGNNQMKLIHVGDKRIVICMTEGKYAAIDDYCTHRGGSLAGGALICGTVQCPWHGSQFNVFTGEVKSGPAKEKIKTYRIKEEPDGIYIEINS